jgi:hypothetical protein
MLLQMHNRYRTSGVSRKQRHEPKRKSSKSSAMILCVQRCKENDVQANADPTHAKCHNHAADGIIREMAFL